MADQAQQIFASIGAMQTLIENFPMSIFNYLKSKSKYTSVIEFVLDLLFYLGVDADYIIETICSKIFKNERDRDNLQKIINFINTAKYATSEDFIYDKLGELDDINSDVLNKIEDVIKVGLVEILTALLSCNCIPVIADNKMDYLKIEGGSSGNIDKTTNGYVSIPVNSFDLFGKLNIPPTSSTGCCYYRVDKMDVYKQIPEFLLTKDEKNGVYVTDDFIEATSDSPGVILVNNATYYKKGKTCSLGVNELYKTNDFDAFLWFVLNRGLVGSQNGTVSTGIQIEKNKMVWDSRLVIKNANGIKRSSDDEWRKWLTSKTKDGGVLSIGSNENSKNLYPIMQLEPDNNIVDTKRIRVAISSQTYYRARNRKTKAGNVVANTLMPNHTMYKFNYDYVKNIKILSGKELLAGMVKYMYGGLHAGINVTFNVTYLQEKIRSVITQMIQDDDLTVENCYFEFSNDEYNNLLNNFDLEKYNAMSVGFGEFTEKPYTDQEVINALMEVTENGTTAGNITTIKKTVDSLTKNETTGSYSISAGLNGQNFIMTFLMAIIMPIVEQLLSPKVVLLFLINMDAAGLINFKDLTKDQQFDLLDIIVKKILSLISAIIIVIKDIIIEILMDLFKEYVQPLLSQFMILILSEKIEKWIEYLTDALSCIPIFAFTWQNYKAQMANITYADINSNAVLIEATPNKKC